MKFGRLILSEFISRRALKWKGFIAANRLVTVVSKLGRKTRFIYCTNNCLEKNENK